MVNMTIPTSPDTSNRSVYLDLFSISQKRKGKPKNETSIFCKYNAPFFAYQIHLSRYGVSQGCCNHWDCPRCGKVRASEEYGRIVSGIRTLALSFPIYFATITAPGGELTADEADEKWPLWSNRLFSAWRARTKSRGGQWHYVAVTERQKRGHAHFHLLITADPGDLYLGHVYKERKENIYTPANAREIALRSDWLAVAIQRAGFGSQYDISIASSIEGTSRYVAKYLFKPSIFEDCWPKKWKRVRYSHSFPKLPEKKTDAFVLISETDWNWLGRRSSIVEVKDSETLLDVRWKLRNSDCIVVQK